LYGPVYCENVIGLKHGCLYKGYIDEKQRTEVIVVKEKQRDVLCKCHLINKNEDDTNKYILERLSCEIVNSYHYIAYKKFDHTLTSFVNSKDCNKTSLAKVVKVLIKATHSLHNQNIVHCNINPDVIVITIVNGQSKVQFLDIFLYKNSLDEQIDSLDNVFEENEFAAPELTQYYNHMKQKRPGKKFERKDEIRCQVDIFSLGCCIFYAYTKVNPFYRDGYSTTKNILNANFKIDFLSISFLPPSLVSVKPIICSNSL
jgi:serine/threonine protein kinase